MKYSNNGEENMRIKRSQADLEKYKNRFLIILCDNDNIYTGI